MEAGRPLLHFRGLRDPDLPTCLILTAAPGLAAWRCPFQKGPPSKGPRSPFGAPATTASSISISFSTASGHTAPAVAVLAWQSPELHGDQEPGTSRRCEAYPVPSPAGGQTGRMCHVLGTANRLGPGLSGQRIPRALVSWLQPDLVSSLLSE